MQEPKESLSSTIRVERDGVRLGWNVVATLATIGLGFYVASVITPLTTKITDLEAKQKDLTIALSAVDTALKVHLAHTELRKDIEFARDEIKRMEKELKYGPKGKSDNRISGEG